jgi:hypothetical protein
MVIMVVCIIPLSTWGNEGKADDAKESPITSMKKDIKKLPGPKVSEIPEKYNDLLRNFSDYYDALKIGDFEKAYNFESGEYRKATSFDLYKERHKNAAAMIAVRPLEVKPINEKEVMVRASFGYKVAAVDTVRFIPDHWVKEDNAWRHLPEEEN